MNGYTIRELYVYAEVNDAKYITRKYIQDDFKKSAGPFNALSSFDRQMARHLCCRDVTKLYA